MQKSRHGFTLIELLVVLAIIGILAAMLFPAIAKVREKGKRAACKTHLEGLFTVMTLYAGDNEGWLVHTKELDNAGNRPTEWPFRDHILLLASNGYLETPSTLICPSDKYDGASGSEVKVAAAKEFTKEAFGSGVGTISYMYIAGYRMGGMHDPAVSPVLADESNEKEDGPGMAGDMPDITDRDNHGAQFRNVIYLDGHVVSFDEADSANAIFDSVAGKTDPLASTD